MGDDDNLGLDVADGSVLLTVDATGFAFLKDAKKIELDGDFFSVEGDPSPFGILGNPQFYQFLLKRQD